MKPITIHQVRAAVGGRALSPLPAVAPEIRCVCTDTRRMVPGSLFVALKGDNFDAHRFLAQVAAGGAVAASAYARLAPARGRIERVAHHERVHGLGEPYVGYAAHS